MDVGLSTRHQGEITTTSYFIRYNYVITRQRDCLKYFAPNSIELYFERIGYIFKRDFLNTLIMGNIVPLSMVSWGNER